MIHYFYDFEPTSELAGVFGELVKPEQLSITSEPFNDHIKCAEHAMEFISDISKKLGDSVLVFFENNGTYTDDTDDVPFENDALITLIHVFKNDKETELGTAVVYTEYYDELPSEEDSRIVESRESLEITMKGHDLLTHELTWVKSVPPEQTWLYFHNKSRLLQ